MLAGFSFAQPWMLLLFAFGMCAADASQLFEQGYLSRRQAVVVA